MVAVMSEPERLVPLIALMLTIVTMIVGTGRWSVAACAAVLVGSLVFLLRKVVSDQWLLWLAAAGFSGAVVLFVALLFFSRSDARNERNAARTEIASLKKRLAEPVGTDFVVFAAGSAPSQDFGSEFAYEFPEPSTLYASPRAARHEIGGHVRVECHVAGEDWYRITNGNFMEGTAIELAPHSGLPPPRDCPS